MEQKIAVWIDDKSSWKSTLRCGVELAHLLGKDLLIVSSDGKKRKPKDGMDETLEQELKKLEFRYEVDLFDAGSKLEKHFDFLAKEQEVLVYVFPKKGGHKRLSTLKSSPTPFLFVGSETDMSQLFHDIVVPVGYMAKAKDSALWASYIARYNKTKVTLLSATESHNEDQHDVNAHVYSIENLYEKFGFPFAEEKSGKPTWRIQEYALSFAKEKSAGLLILAGTKQLSVLDNLLPLPEKKLLKNSGSIPVMFVNSQREMYVLCG